MSAVQPKKKNIFKFLQSKEFDEARVKMCTLYILLSYANELHEDVDRLLQGYEGLWIGELKHASKQATKALEAYDKLYLSFISDGGGKLTDTNVDVTSAIDVAMEQNKFFLMEGYKAIKKVIEEQVDKNVVDEKELAKGFLQDHDICTYEERKQMLDATLRRCRLKIDDFHGDVLKGVEVGFNAALDFLKMVVMNNANETR